MFLTLTLGEARQGLRDNGSSIACTMRDSRYTLPRITTWSNAAALGSKPNPAKASEQHVSKQPAVSVFSRTQEPKLRLQTYSGSRFRCQGVKTELRAIQLGDDVRLESTWYVSFIDVFVCLCLVLNVRILRRSLLQIRG